jgi:hypothetical protein
MKNKRNNIEERLQVSVSKYIKLKYPDVVFTSESSGIRLPMHLAKLIKSQRSKHKQLDMIMLEARGGYNGLIMELKKDNNEVYNYQGEYRRTIHIQEQLKTINLLKRKGYLARFVCGLDEAVMVIDNYMKMEKKY